MRHGLMATCCVLDVCEDLLAVGIKPGAFLLGHTAGSLFESVVLNVVCTVSMLEVLSLM